MGTTNVMIWIEVEDEDAALEVSEQVGELLEAHVVRPGIRLKGIVQEAPEAACGLACEGPRRIQGFIDGEPTSDIYVVTTGGERIGILQFLRQDGNRSVKGRSIKIEVIPPGAGCNTCSV